MIDTTTTTETIYIADLQEQIKTLKILLERQSERLHEKTNLTEGLQEKLEKCKAFFDIEVDTLSKNWNKLYHEAKESTSERD
jgi:hypothetical protein